VVAYGLFKNPQLTVQDAYNIVKGHSRWIGPNMNLIYQLSEFKSKLQRGQGPSGPAWHSWRSTGSGRLTLSSGKPAVSRLILSPATTADGQDRQPVRSNSWTPPHTSALAQTSLAGNVSPGPSSAPPDVQSYPSITGDSLRGKVDSPDVIGLERELSPDPKEMDIDSCRPSETPAGPDSGPGPDVPSPVPHPAIKPEVPPAGFSSLSSRRQGPQTLSLRHNLPGFLGNLPARTGFDHVMVDRVPPSPSIMSPRAAEFTASPFHRTAAGDLAGSSVFEQGLMSPKPRRDDPRSPPSRGEAPIMRNIFGVL
jgi:tyrosine-protein phosphatase